MTLRLVGVPSSAGAHAPGVEGGPAHLRRAGLLQALRAAGVDAVDGGDLPPGAFGTDPAPSGARNLPAVVANARRVAEAVAAARAAGEIPVLLGGDCTLVLGAVRALGPGCGVFYLDGDADLDVPGEGWGVLDSCGVAHLLGDGDRALAADLTGADVVLFGFHPAQLSAGQWHRLARHRPIAVPAPDVPAGGGRAAARRALATLGDRPALVVHLDVDAVDYASFPLADCPRYHGGLALDDAMAALAVAASRPDLACLTITEVNPGHDASGRLARALVTAWAGAVAEGLAARR